MTTAAFTLHFSLAASHDLLLAVHAEDEALIHERKALFQGRTDPKTHSEWRNDEVAVRATAKAIELSRLYKTRLHLSCAHRHKGASCNHRPSKKGRRCRHMLRQHPIIYS